jgi:hypothetical protein
MNLSPETVIVSGGKSTLTHLNFAPSFWGLLYVDLSYEGSQIILPSDSDKYFSEQQDVAMHIKTILFDTDINLTAQIKDIVPARFYNCTRYGVQFTELESNQEARDAIRKIYEYGEKLKAVRKTQ